MRDRGQLYTLEGIIASLIILLGLFFALQATTATPGATGTINPHAEQQDRVVAGGVLNAANDSQLRQAALFWDDGFHCSPSGTTFYPGTTDIGACSIDTGDWNADRLPPNELGRILEQRFGEAYSYNVVVAYNNTGGEFARQRMVYQGEPSSSAVRARTSIVLTNDQQLYEADDDLGNPTGPTLADDPDDFYAPPSDGDATDDDIYNVLYVEVVVWR